MGRPRKEDESAAIAAVAAAVSESTVEVFDGLIASVNLDDPAMIEKHSGRMVFKRYVLGVTNPVADGWRMGCPSVYGDELCWLLFGCVNVGAMSRAHPQKGLRMVVLP